MKLDDKFEVGMKVHFTSLNGKKENGIVKDTGATGMGAWVVYHCNEDWENYRNYTGQYTHVLDLTPGWYTEPETLLEKAIEFATHAHRNQVRKYTNEPYITHCLSVMERLKALDYPEHILCAAVLHDTIEDTFVIYNDICSYFPKHIADLVHDLTDKYTSEAYPMLNREERKHLECLRLSKISVDAKNIKLADLIDNTSSIVQYDPKFAEVYLKEKKSLLDYALSSGTDWRLHSQTRLVCYDSLGWVPGLRNNIPDNLKKT